MVTGNQVNFDHAAYLRIHSLDRPLGLGLAVDVHAMMMFLIGS